MPSEHRNVPLRVWQAFVASYGSGAVIDGLVTRVVPFGAFIDVGGGIQGLLHETNWFARPKHGFVIQVRVAAIDVENRRISLVEV